MELRALEILVRLLDPRKLRGRLRLLWRTVVIGGIASIWVVLRSAWRMPIVRAERRLKHARRQDEIDERIAAMELARLQDGWQPPPPAAKGPRRRPRGAAHGTSL